MSNIRYTLPQPAHTARTTSRARPVLDWLSLVGSVVAAFVGLALLASAFGATPARSAAGRVVTPPALSGAPVDPGAIHETQVDPAAPCANPDGTRPFVTSVTSASGLTLNNLCIVVTDGTATPRPTATRALRGGPIPTATIIPGVTK